MAQPLGLVGMGLQAHAADKGFVAPHDDHDQQIGDHDHIDQGQYHQHDDGFVQMGDLDIAFVANIGDQGMQGFLIAEDRLHQMPELQQKVPDIDTLGGNQTQVQRQLQPAAGKDQRGQGTQYAGRLVAAMRRVVVGVACFVGRDAAHDVYAGLAGCDGWATGCRHLVRLVLLGPRPGLPAPSRAGRNVGPGLWSSRCAILRVCSGVF